MTIGIGIIGTGKHGARYLSHVGEVPSLRLAAISRRNRTLGEHQAETHRCRFHADPAALIADPTVDAVVLVVPPTLNVELATAAARAGKSLLIEKPLAPTVSECRRIAAAVESAGVMAMVAHTLRFNAVVKTVRQAVPSIGPLHGAVLTQRFEPSKLGWLDRQKEAGGGIILHTGVHSFDLLRHLTGREALQVTASAKQIATLDTEDSFAATIEMEGALLALVAGSRATAGRSGSIEMAGRDGQLAADHVHGVAARLVGATRSPLEIGEAFMTVSSTLREFAGATHGASRTGGDARRRSQRGCDRRSVLSVDRQRQARAGRAVVIQLTPRGD